MNKGDSIMAIAEVKMHNGSPALFIDGKVYPPMYATIRTINGEENVIDEEYYKKLGESGIKANYQRSNVGSGRITCRN